MELLGWAVVLAIIVILLAQRGAPTRPNGGL
jgi:hypothetical protein